MSDIEQVTVAEGKYTVVIDGGKLTALRYGEPWRDLCGDNLIYWLAVELQAARAALAERARNATWPGDNQAGAEVHSQEAEDMTGPADTTLGKCTTSTPFKFEFDPEDNGHTMILAPTRTAPAR